MLSHAKINLDRNGNKVVALVGTKSSPGFSVQTNGNLPNTHSTGRPDFEEITAYILQYGTERQKELIKQFVQVTK